MTPKQLQRNIERLKNYEFGDPVKYTPKTPPKYEHFEHRKRIIRIGRKTRRYNHFMQKRLI